jgi:hypothetical protein
MFNAPRNDQELSFLEPNVPIPELHAESALHHEKQLVLVIVMVPHERAQELDQLDLLAIELSGDFRAPVLSE